MRLAMKIKFGIEVNGYSPRSKCVVVLEWHSYDTWREREEMTNAFSHLQVVHSDSGKGVGNGTNQYLALFPDW